MNMFLCCLFILGYKDECVKEGVLPVTVQVLSNELAKEEYVWIVERNDLPNKVHRAEVYLSPTR
jgi:hypothetical protein